MLGQLVSFKVDYRVQSINRDFGTITMNGESISRAVVREGWARLKSAGQSRDGEISPEYDELAKLEAEASAAKRGLFSDDRQGATREVAVSTLEVVGVKSSLPSWVSGGITRSWMLWPTWHLAVECGRARGASAEAQGQAHARRDRVRPGRRLFPRRDPRQLHVHQPVAGWRGLP